MLTPSGATPVLAILREAASERVLVVHSLGDAAVQAGPFPVSAADMLPVFSTPGVKADKTASGWSASEARARHRGVPAAVGRGH